MQPSPSGRGRTPAGRVGWPLSDRVAGPGVRQQWLLTARETEVLAAMASGKTNAAIAGELFISRKAVEKHVNSIFSKLVLPGSDHEHPRVRAVLMYLDHAPAGTPTRQPMTDPAPLRYGLASHPRARATRSRRTCRLG